MVLIMQGYSSELWGPSFAISRVPPIPRTQHRKHVPRGGRGRAVRVLIDATALVFLRDPQLHHQPQHHHDERRAEGGEGHTSRGTSNLLPQEFLISRSSSTRMTGKEQLCV